jgi:hypothetical protein
VVINKIANAQAGVQRGNGAGNSATRSVRRFGASTRQHEGIAKDQLTRGSAVPGAVEISSDIGAGQMYSGLLSEQAHDQGQILVTRNGPGQSIALFDMEPSLFPDRKLPSRDGSKLGGRPANFGTR